MKNTNLLYLFVIMALHPMSATFAQNKPTGENPLLLPLPAIPGNYNPNQKIAYIRVWEPRKASNDTSTGSLNLNANFKQATSYFDGLGRPLQMVVKGNNYDGTKDIVSMNLYDELGREAKQYLPYAPATGNNGKFRGNPFAEQQAYYQLNYSDQTPYSKTEFEVSPLSRTVKTCAPGNSWAGSNRGVSQSLSFNTIADSVKLVTIGFTSNAVPVFGNLYPAGELMKTTSTNEQGVMVVEYKNREGQLILQKQQDANLPGTACTGWANTFYIYDDLGRLRYVLQPKAVELLNAANWQLTTELKNELCFIYEYDAEGRLIYKKVPGAAPEYMCYDIRGRLVCAQTGNLRNNGQWMVTFYDELNRPLGTALYTTAQTREQLQTYLDNITTENPVPVFPETSLARLNNTYYDEYTMPGGAAFNADMMSTAIANISAGDEQAENLAKTNLTRGKVTGRQTRVLGTTAFLLTCTYYDVKGRTIQTQSNNQKGGTDAVSFVYSFTGKILSNYLYHSNPAAVLPGTQTTQIFTRNTFNNDYILKIEKKINDSEWYRLVELQYDNLGRIQKKMMGNTASNFYINMDYNIRGWLTGINKAAQQNLENGAAGTSGFYDAIFSEVLYYENGFTKKYHNGNIAGVKWANAADKQPRSNGFEYDNLNRLLKADFTQKNGTAWDNSAGINYSLKNMRYDINGNILNLSQTALKLNTSADIDNLVYSYLPGSNKLLRVTDSLNDPATKLGDFKDGTNTADDYVYDVNGNMVQDNNKNIGSIIYNHLNLPRKITIPGKGTIEYTYDARGNKLQKLTTEGTKITTTDYVSGFVYQNNELQYVSHEEGRIRYAKKYFLLGDSAYTWQYDFFYKDHLGNIRAIVTEQKDTSKYMASFEMENRPRETALFHKIPETAVYIAETPGYPANGSSGALTSRLNGQGNKVGASITLKVMAGDKVDLAVQYWYPQYSEIKIKNEVKPENLLGVLSNFLSGDASSLSGGKATQAELNQPAILPAAIQGFLDTHGGDETKAGQPNAYLNWILLDEQFKYVPGGSGFIRVGEYGEELKTIGNMGLPIAKSGYLYVYISNETIGANVYFDNLVVQHYTGPLSETTDYTAWGLDMKMLGSKAFGGLENKYRFNGKEKQDKEFGENSGIDWIDFGARFYDNQLGRWLAIDPKVYKYPGLSGYVAFANNAIYFIDPDGKDIVDNNGKKVTYKVLKDGSIKWSKNATADIIRIGNALARTKQGLQQLKLLQSVNYKVYMDIDKKSMPKDKVGNTYMTYAWHPKTKTYDIKDAKITIYEAKLKKYADDINSGTLQGVTEQEKLYAKLSNDIDGSISAVAGHESVHSANRENARQSILNKKTGTNFDLEKEPEKVESTILKQLIEKQENNPQN